MMGIFIVYSTDAESTNTKWLVLLRVVAQQSQVAKAQSKGTGFRAPIAVVPSAKVSSEIGRRLTEIAGKQTLRLRPDEWNSRDTFWIIDMLGDADGIGHALKQLMAGPFEGKDVKAVVRGG